MLHPSAQTVSPLSPASASAASARTAASSPSSSSSSSPPPASTDPGVDLTSTFLQLLSVQLENQSPMNPVDPNQFVTQLATFDSLGELTQIQSLMQTLVNDVGGTSGAPSGASATASANLTSNPISISH
jgi:flagellar basal-body rod modification protein FlgD